VAADPLIGRELGKCLIESRIGAGGMGVVYLAQHQVIGDRRAVKVLSLALANQEGYRERFLKEARLPASLNHPSILPVYDAGDEDGVLYLVMPYIRGADLQAILDDGGPLDIDEAVSILGPVADALDEAHASNLIHRDVKPSNVLVGEVGSKGRHVYLSDFGLVKAADEVARASGTTQGMVVGTPPYIPPELWKEEPFDGSLDQYALACTLFHALAGRPPFEATTMYAWMYAHTEGPIPSASALRPQLPKEVDGPLARGLAKDPGDRFESCTALIEAVGASVGALPPAPADTLENRLRDKTRIGIETVARQRSGGGGGKPPKRTWPRYALVAAAVVVVLATLAWLLRPSGSRPAVVTGPTSEIAVLQPEGELGARPIAVVPDRSDASVVVALQGEPGLGTEIQRLNEGEATPVAAIHATPLQMVDEEGQKTWILTREGPLFLVEGDGSDPVEIPLGGHGARMAATTHFMWVTMPIQDNVKLVHEDDPKIIDTTRVEGGPRFLTVASHAMLVVGDDGTVSSLDLGTGQVVDTTDLGGAPVSLTSARGDGWVATSDGKILQIEVVNDVLSVSQVADLGGSPLRISPSGEGGGAVWVPDTTTPRLTRIATLPPHQSETARFPDALVLVSTVDPRVVVTVTAAGEVYRVDATSAEILGEPERIVDTPRALVVIEGDAVIFAADGSVYVIKLEPSQG
jgi:tRNA A-37 threonylcarbamoyl transferase component Bud32